MPGKDYYIGLDCGTSSVGWAVTDEKYNLLRAKGKTLWGARLFDEAETAAERRAHRSARRRGHRAHARLKLLEMLFADEMAKIDPDFYLRLEKAALIEEDRKEAIENSPKHLSKSQVKTKYTLFNDPDFTDKDFYKAFPTIWHLRDAIINGNAPKTKLSDKNHFDLHLYFLAIHHILKNRGHFLREEKELERTGDFSELFKSFCNTAEKAGLTLKKNVSTKIQEIIDDEKNNASTKAKQIKKIFCDGGEGDEATEKRLASLAKMLVGLAIKPSQLFEDFNSEEEKSISFNKSNIEEILTQTEELLDPEDFALIEATKKIYDHGILNKILSASEDGTLSSAMVQNYNKHREQLAELKKLLKPFKADYNLFFNTAKVNVVGNQKKVTPVCYNAYIGHATEANKKRQKTTKVSQEEINIEIERLLVKHQIETPLLELARKRELLPKQKGQARGTIPQQLHHSELIKILKRLEADYPSFAMTEMGKISHITGDEDENGDYSTNSKKIARIHNFRLPYYCGPIVKGKYNNRHQLIDDGVSEFSWADKPINEVVTPWNFDKIPEVDLDGRAENFINRMTNSCNFLSTENKVLPKNSPLYQRFALLNNLNNLKIDGSRLGLDVETKKWIYEHAFKNYEISGNVKIKTLEKWLANNSKKYELSGIAEDVILPKLSTRQDFIKIFGEKHGFTSGQIEKVVYLITILNNEPKMLQRKIIEELGEDKCSEKQATQLAKKSYKAWSNVSERFLTGIYCTINGQRMNIITALYETNNNLSELLSSKYGFKKEIDKINKDGWKKAKITFADIDELYCSPAVKRMIWQTLKVVDELVKVEKTTPEKIFIESTRREDAKNKGKESLRRQKELQQYYAQLDTTDQVAKRVSEELNCELPERLQSKKVYLYYTQLGRCAYCGKEIHLNDDCDIDHIYPRSKTKDNSPRNNLVLVHSEENRDKSNKALSGDIQARMRTMWHKWHENHLINDEKYYRLTRRGELSPEELSHFVSRQLVETSQSVKLLRDLLAQACPDTKIILVKADQVHSFREYFARGDDGKNKIAPNPEFVKVRALNDFHHAKDAYLNIVVGNVMNLTFTDDPRSWLENEEHYRQFSMNDSNLWRTSERKCNFLEGWNYDDSIEIISKNIARNDILWTRMVKDESKELYNTQLVGKNVRGASTEDSDLLPKKRGKFWRNTDQYGGYNKISNAFFAIIEQEQKKKIVSVPIINSNNPNQYLKNKYRGCKVIFPHIPVGAKIQVDSQPMLISGKSQGGKSFVLAPAKQLIITGGELQYLSRTSRVANKLKQRKDYKVRDADGVSVKQNLRVYDVITERLSIFSKMPELGGHVKKFADAKEKFAKLEIEKQCSALHEILEAFNCTSSVKNLSSFMPGASAVGRCSISHDLSKYHKVSLWHQSVTGIFEKETPILGPEN